MDGETVGIGEPFSNGLYYPGDSQAGDVDEVAGCTCVLTISGGPTAYAQGSQLMDLSRSDNTIVRAYQYDGGEADGAAAINNGLRDAARAGVEPDAAVAARRDALQSIIDRQPPLKEDQTYWRAYTGMTVENTPSIFTNGAEFVDAGFTSATTSEAVARDFADQLGGKVVELHVPAGTRVFDFANYALPNGADEVILPSGTQWDVARVTEPSGLSHWEMNLTDTGITPEPVTAVGDIPFDGGMDAVHEAERAREAWVAGITNPQDKALAEDWSSIGFNPVNSYARGTDIADSASTRVEISSETHPMGEWPSRTDRFIEQSGATTSGTETLYRGMRPRTLEDLHPGDVFTDKGFPFVSHDAGVAMQFGSGAVDQIAEIRVPGEMPRILGDWTSFREEILPRNITFDVTGERQATIVDELGGVHDVRIVTMEPHNAEADAFKQITGTELNTYGQQFADFTTSRSPAEQAALKDYRHGVINDAPDFRSIGRYLRDGTVKDTLTEAQLQTAVANIDSVEAEAVIPEDIKLYRALDVKEAGIKDLKPGDIFTDKSFTSTSISNAYAKDWARNYTDREVITIEAPAGSHGIYLDNFYGGLKDDTYREYEFLLPRNTSYEVVHNDDLGVVLRLVETPKPITALEAPPASATFDIASYTSGQSSHINWFLRKGEWPDALGPAGERNAQATIDGLDSAFAEAPRAQENFTVYRGITTQGRYGDVLKGLKPGDVFKDDGFISTTLDEKMAPRFGDVRATIEVTPGTPYLDTTQSRAGIAGEQEVMLPRGTQFEVVSRDGSTIHLRVVPSEAQDVKIGDVTSGFKPFDLNPPKIDEYPGLGISDSSFMKDLRQSYVDNGGEQYAGAQTDAARVYTGSGYSPINKGLRDEVTLDPKLQETVDTLTTAINQGTVPNNVTLFRGVRGDFADTFGQLHPGDVFTDKGFVSTTTDASAASSFANAYGGTPGAVIRIQVDAGTPAYAVGSLSEREVLFAPGTQFEVIDAPHTVDLTTVETSLNPARKTGEMLVVDVRMIPPVTSTAASDLVAQAATLSSGGSIPEDSRLASAIDTWTTNMNADPIIEQAANVAPESAPTLYRGMSMSPDYGWTDATSREFIDTLHPGNDLSIKFGSWTAKPTIADEFAGIENGSAVIGEPPTGVVIQPGEPRVLFQLKPGAGALNLEPAAAPEFAYQREWIPATDRTYHVVDVQRSIDTVEGVDTPVYRVTLEQNAVGVAAQAAPAPSALAADRARLQELFTMQQPGGLTYDQMVERNDLIPKVRAEMAQEWEATHGPITTETFANSGAPWEPPPSREVYDAWSGEAPPPSLVQGQQSVFDPETPNPSTNEKWAQSARDDYVVNDAKTTANLARMRSGDLPNGAWVSKMDKLTHLGTLTDDTTLYRDAVLPPQTIADMQPGTAFTDHAFASVTPDFSEAQSYGEIRSEALARKGDLNGQIVHFVIDARQGEPMVDVGYGEFVLPRNSTWTVRQLQLQSDGSYVARVTLNAPTEGAAPAVAAPATVATGPNYTTWSNTQLRDELRRRGMPTSYLKPQLIQMLQEDDAAIVKVAIALYKTEVNS